MGCIVHLVDMTDVGEPTSIVAGVLHFFTRSLLVVVVVLPSTNLCLVITAQVTLFCLALLANNLGTVVLSLASLGSQPCHLVNTLGTAGRVARQVAERIELCQSFLEGCASVLDKLGCLMVSVVHDICCLNVIIV